MVSAVYNVEKYLDDYFESLTRQTLKFEDHIDLVLVDDGSPDNSAEIIKKWQKRYPKNITYIKKENGGQASARNLGLEYVHTEWVTFIDPDDFVNITYFEVVDQFLEKKKNKNIGLVSCNFIFYYEDKHIMANSHPLNYRFRQKETIVTPQNMQGFIQLSANSVFFKKNILDEEGLYFHENIKPNFEDGHFVNQYFVHNPKIHIAFLKEAKYFYRKRSDGTSTLDTSWQSVGRFSAVLKNGYLDILKISQNKLGKVPLYLQRTILYDLMWHFSLLVNNGHKLNHLNGEQKTHYLVYIKEIFQYIDVDTIENFELAGITDMYKVGLLGIYKNHVSSIQKIYIDSYDDAKDEIRIRFFYYDDIAIQFYVDDTLTEARISKIKKYDFVNQIFVYEKIIWLPLSKSGKHLNIKVYNADTHIHLNKNLFKNKIKIPDIIHNLSKKYQTLIKYIPPFKYNNALLLLDRDTQADDNAEHLYRYLMQMHPGVKIFFILSKKSDDWKRLHREGFKLIPFGSLRHLLALLKADHLISSQADHYVTDYIPRKYFNAILNYKYTFLQHGVIKDDLSSWLNGKTIDCFITTSNYEYLSICADFTQYNFTKKETVLTGLPRHDALLNNNYKLKEKTILIMPTWRQTLVGKSVGKTHIREFNENFQNTLYFKRWFSFLHSAELHTLIKKYHYTILFYPHTNIQPYLDLFCVPTYIKTINHHKESIQVLFKKSALLITDYSSVAFEMAILRRGILYYQFDKDQIFSGAHTYQKGYYDYDLDGFGPVCIDEVSLLNELEYLLQNDGVPNEKYFKRMETFFKFHDTDNCKRTYEAILQLEQPLEKEV